MTWLKWKWRTTCSFYKVELHELPLNCQVSFCFSTHKGKKWNGIIHARHVWMGRYYGHQPKNYFFSLMKDNYKWIYNLKLLAWPWMKHLRTRESTPIFNSSTHPLYSRFSPIFLIQNEHFFLSSKPTLLYSLLPLKIKTSNFLFSSPCLLSFLSPKLSTFFKPFTNSFPPLFLYYSLSSRAANLSSFSLLSPANPFFHWTWFFIAKRGNNLSLSKERHGPVKRKCQLV